MPFCLDDVSKLPFSCFKFLGSELARAVDVAGLKVGHKICQAICPSRIIKSGGGKNGHFNSLTRGIMRRGRIVGYWSQILPSGPDASVAVKQHRDSAAMPFGSRKIWARRGCVGTIMLAPGNAPNPHSVDDVEE